VADGKFDYGLFTGDIYQVVRAMDNVIDRTIYPLEEQKTEALAKRRMGLGVTALANAGEMMGMPYGSPEFIKFTAKVLETLRDYSYAASSDLAKEKGSFPLYEPALYQQGNFYATLSDWVKEKIVAQGLRNSHLTSIAPTGTISLTADNVSSGIEPPFSLFYDRTIQTFDGATVERVEDYAYAKGVKGLTANEISAQDHVRVLGVVSGYVDSAVSKTCNVGDDVSYDDFKLLYENAWAMGCKGITTFRASGKRYGILNEVKPPQNDDDEPTGAEACFIDPTTGQKECA
jgi:ribonucleoside-diphosphate reductase alpha chain